MNRSEEPYSQKMQDELIATNFIIEMAKADYYIDPTVPMKNPAVRKIYDHYVGCFLRTIHRMMARGECVISIGKKPTGFPPMGGCELPERGEE